MKIKSKIIKIFSILIFFLLFIIIFYFAYTQIPYVKNRRAVLKKHEETMKIINEAFNERIKDAPSFEILTKKLPPAGFKSILNQYNNWLRIDSVMDINGEVALLVAVEEKKFIFFKNSEIPIENFRNMYPTVNYYTSTIWIKSSGGAIDLYGNRLNLEKSYMDIEKNDGQIIFSFDVNRNKVYSKREGGGHLTYKGQTFLTEQSVIHDFINANGKLIVHFSEQSNNNQTLHFVYFEN